MSVIVNDGDNVSRVCLHPEHFPPTLLYIPAGSSRTFICPGCGKQTQVHGGPLVTC